MGREVERAASKHKQIIALKVDAAVLTPALEYFLSESQWIDVAALGMPSALANLAEAVRHGSVAAHANRGLDGCCRLGQHDHARTAIEKLHAQGLLEVLDLVRDRRLRDCVEEK